MEVAFSLPIKGPGVLQHEAKGRKKTLETTKAKTLLHVKGFRRMLMLNLAALQWKSIQRTIPEPTLDGTLAG